MLLTVYLRCQLHHCQLEVATTAYSCQHTRRWLVGSLVGLAYLKSQMVNRCIRYSVNAWRLHYTAQIHACTSTCAAYTFDVCNPRFMPSRGSHFCLRSRWGWNPSAAVQNGAEDLHSQKQGPHWVTRKMVLTKSISAIIITDVPYTNLPNHIPPEEHNALFNFAI